MLVSCQYKNRSDQINLPHLSFYKTIILVYPHRSHRRWYHLHFQWLNLHYVSFLVSHRYLPIALIVQTTVVVVGRIININQWIYINLVIYMSRMYEFRCTPYKRMHYISLRMYHRTIELIYGPIEFQSHAIRRMVYRNVYHCP